MGKFNHTTAPKLPRLVCIGVVSEIAPTKVSDSGNYNVTKVKIAGLEGSRDFTFSLLTRPEWLTNGYNPDEAMEGDNGATFVYSKNISPSIGRGIGILQGLPGSEENCDKMTDALFASAKEMGEAPDLYQGVEDGDLDAVLQKFCVGKTVGYILKQKEEETGLIDANGKKQRVRTANYEMDQLFYPTKDAIERFKKTAEKKADDWKIAFEA